MLITVGALTSLSYTMESSWDMYIPPTFTYIGKVGKKRRIEKRIKTKNLFLTTLTIFSVCTDGCHVKVKQSKNLFSKKEKYTATGQLIGQLRSEEAQQLWDTLARDFEEQEMKIS